LLNLDALFWKTGKFSTLFDTSAG